MSRRVRARRFLVQFLIVTAAVLGIAAVALFLLLMDAEQKSRKEDTSRQPEIFDAVPKQAEEMHSAEQESDQMAEMPSKPEDEQIVTQSTLNETNEDLFAASGIHEECFRLIEDIIETDVRYGFPGAQLAVMRGGRLIYANAWGSKNAYLPDGTPNPDGGKVDNDTLYDLASVSKIIGVNYALQKLVSEGRLTLDEHVTDYLGERFSADTLEIRYKDGTDADLETQRQWKAALTLRELLMHQGGFPADPRYFNPYINAATQEYDPDSENVLFAGNGADEATRQATVEAICRTPLLYEPGTKTVYSDTDYMILGLVVESITGKDLDTCLKEEFCNPMGLTHVTYNPLQHGFSATDCAATELNGNTRDGYITFDGIRTYTLQGEVHDEKAWYSMGGVSGHAGLFSNATDLARLGNLMLSGKIGDRIVFTPEVIRDFTAPKSPEAKNWGLGWWRQGDAQRTKYFGTGAGDGVFGHQGWTGTLLMIDPERELVIAFLTNKINSPVTDKKSNANKFNGNWYTTSTLGFVPEILYRGMDEDTDVTGALEEVIDQLVADAEEAVTSRMPDSHPAVKNRDSKREIAMRFSEETGG